MTEQLRTLMDREADLDFAAVDVDAITAAGDRTVRRRRIATGLAGVTALAVVAGGAALLGANGGHDRTDVVDAPIRTDVPTWTEGSTLHLDDRTVDLGVPVVALARTGAGIVFQGDDDGIYRYTGSAPVRIGTVAGGEEMDVPSLVGDADGTLVGWVDASGAKPAFVVHDVATGAEQRFDEHTDAAMKAADYPDVAFFMAIDGRTAYWLDRRGTVATDVDTGQARVLGGPDAPVFVADAEAGLYLKWIEDEDGGDLGTDVVDADGRVVLGWRDAGSLGTLSPDGRWGAGLETATLVDIRTGAEHPIETGQDGDAIGYDWLDGDTLMVLAQLDGDRIALLRCEAPAGGCSDVATLSLTGGRVALPAPALLGVVSLSGGEASGSSEDEAVESSAATERPE